MKKILLLFIPLVFFFGCETDQENITDCQLIGLWNLDSEVYPQGIDGENYETISCWCGYVSDACTHLYTYYDFECCRTFDFQENGSLAVLEYCSSSNEFNSEENWTWSSDDCGVGDLIILNEGGTDTMTITIQAISENNLTLYVQDGGYEAEGFYLYLSK